MGQRMAGRTTTGGTGRAPGQTSSPPHARAARAGPYHTAKPGPGRPKACGLHKVIAGGAGPGAPARPAGQRKAASAPGPRSVRTTEAGRGLPGPSRDSGPRQRAGRGLATPGLVPPPRPGTAGRGRAALPSPPRPAAARRRPLTLLRRPALPRQEGRGCRGEGIEGGLRERGSPCRGWFRPGLARLAGWAGQGWRCRPRARFP